MGLQRDCACLHDDSKTQMEKTQQLDEDINRVLQELREANERMEVELGEIRARTAELEEDRTRMRGAMS